MSLYDPLNTFVCVECYKPAYLVYLKSEKLCIECGGSFYNRWEVVCSDCRIELLNLAAEVDDPEDVLWIVQNISTTHYQTWKSHAQKAQTIVAERLAPHVSVPNLATQATGSAPDVPPRPRKGPGACGGPRPRTPILSVEIRGSRKN